MILRASILVALACLAACTAVESERGDASSGELQHRRMSRTQLVNSLEALFPGARLTLDPGALPADIAVGAFDNNIEVTGVTVTHVDAWYRVARQVSDDVVASFDAVSGCNVDDRACASNWAANLLVRAWRRPPEADEMTDLLSHFDGWWSAGGEQLAVASWVQFVLLSPEFLYFVEFGEAPDVEAAPRRLTSYEVATRLAFLIWNGPPDDELLRLAGAGALRDSGAVEAEARRLIEDPRAEDGVSNFYRQLLDWDRFGTVDLDFETYFSDLVWDDAANVLHMELQPAMRLESEAFVRGVVFDDRGGLGDLLTSSRTWANELLAERVYRVELTADEPGIHLTGPPPPGIEYRYESEFFPVDLPPEQRAGFLTQSGFLHSHSHSLQPSPVLRGVFVLDRLLCAPPAAPPQDVPALEERANANAVTNRDRYAAHTDNPACSGCHVPIDGIGFGFEHFDSLGRFRTEDNGQPVDATGLLAFGDQAGEFDGAVDLAHALATSRTVYDCHVVQWFRYAHARRETPADAEEISALQQRFWDSNGDVLELLVAIASSESFLTLPTADE